MAENKFGFIPEHEEKEDDLAVDRLMGYGVLPATVRALVASHGVERVAAMTDYIDSQLQGPASRKIANPAGLLIHSLKNVPSFEKRLLNATQTSLF